jgi:hypothetical protein
MSGASGDTGSVLRSILAARGKEQWFGGENRGNEAYSDDEKSKVPGAQKVAMGSRETYNYGSLTRNGTVSLKDALSGDPATLNDLDAGNAGTKMGEYLREE